MMLRALARSLVNTTISADIGFGGRGAVVEAHSGMGNYIYIYISYGLP